MGLSLFDYEKIILANKQRAFFGMNHEKSLQELKDAQERIIKINDTTVKDAQESKRIWEKEINPNLQRVRSMFDFLLYSQMMQDIFSQMKGMVDPVSLKDAQDWLVKADLDFNSFGIGLSYSYGHSLNEKWRPLIEALRAIKIRYGFFHYGVEFSRRISGL